jgi:predicted DNA-binding protein (UPF0251 family)
MARPKHMRTVQHHHSRRCAKPTMPPADQHLKRSNLSHQNLLMVNVSGVKICTSEDYEESWKEILRGHTDVQKTLSLLL